MKTNKLFKFSRIGLALFAMIFTSQIYAAAAVKKNGGGNDQASWQGIPFGISEQELLKKKPEIIRLNKTSEIASPPMYSNYELEDFPAAGRNFKVRFYFGNNSNALQEIHLSMKGKAVAVDCKDFQAALSDKYGKVLSELNSVATYSTITRLQWMTAKMKIELVCGTGDFQMIQILYSSKENISQGL